MSAHPRRFVNGVAVHFSKALIYFIHAAVRSFDQAGIISEIVNRIIGILTLFRTKIDGAFSDEDMFYLRSCGAHLNLLIYHLCKTNKSSTSISDWDLEAMRQQYALTNRETQLLARIYQYYNIDEMARELGITEHTVQKHLQNLFKKMNVSSRWDILRISSRLHHF